MGHHVQAKPPKRSHASHRRHVPLKLGVAAGSVAPLVRQDTKQNLSYCLSSGFRGAHDILALTLVFLLADDINNRCLFLPCCCLCVCFGRKGRRLVLWYLFRPGTRSARGACLWCSITWLAGHLLVYIYRIFKKNFIEQMARIQNKNKWSIKRNSTHKRVRGVIKNTVHVKQRKAKHHSQKSDIDFILSDSV